jgi:hypothetical protein
MIPRPNDRIRLDISVLDTLFHSPAALARRLAKLDQLSWGRLLIRLGQGWMMRSSPRQASRRRAAAPASPPCMTWPLMTQRLRQKGVEPGGANSFHPWVHLRVTPPDLASPRLLVNHPPTTDRKGAWAR